MKDRHRKPVNASRSLADSRKNRTRPERLIYDVESGWGVPAILALAASKLRGGEAWPCHTICWRWMYARDILPHRVLKPHRKPIIWHMQSAIIESNLPFGLTLWMVLPGRVPDASLTLVIHFYLSEQVILAQASP